MATTVEALRGKNSERMFGVAIRDISIDLYEAGHSTLMGIPEFTKAYAEESWAGISSQGWITAKFEVNGIDFLVRHHRRWGVLAIYRETVDLETGGISHTRAIVCIANQNTSIGNYNSPYFSYQGTRNTEQTERDFRDFLADIAKQTQPKI